MKFNRRSFCALAFAAAAACALTSTPASARETVAFNGYKPGTIVVFTNARTLFYVTGPGQALRYPVGVGRAGMAWHGHAYIERKLIRPSWGPPDDIKRENPTIPDYIPGGSPRNPMGAAALGLDRGNYAIHGTNNPGSVGHFVSHGCIRMYNQDVMELYRYTRVGTPVVVLP
jgi:lipoprotein-anchoring transpeptidase ErfK/SrfK